MLRGKLFYIDNIKRVSVRLHTRSAVLSEKREGKKRKRTDASVKLRFDGFVMSLDCSVGLFQLFSEGISSRAESADFS